MSLIFLHWINVEFGLLALRILAQVFLDYHHGLQISIQILFDKPMLSIVPDSMVCQGSIGVQKLFLSLVKELVYANCNEATMKSSFGHFSRILIEIDLKLELRDRILVEREGYAFFVEVEYERLPYLCSSCETIGHSISNCKKQQQVNDSSAKGMEGNKEVPKKNVQYVPKVSNAENKPLDKGNAIVHQDPPNLLKENLVDMADPSNSKVISVETVVDPKAFVGINNVPADDLEAQKSRSPILGFIHIESSESDEAQKNGVSNDNGELSSSWSDKDAC